MEVDYMNAILVGIETKNDRYDIAYSLDELRALALVLDIHTIYTVQQKLDKPSPSTYVGAGKLTEIAAAVLAYNADLVIFNDELSPAQLENCKDALGCEVMDRSFLILKIFEEHAQTKEAKIQVKLAKNMYLLPRVQFMNPGEKRVSGASGITRGKGETSKELNRRFIEGEINRLNKELKDIQSMKDTQIDKRKRNEIPIVALVGYTNAGKSSTMNSILDFTKKNETDEIKDVYAKDQLFSTLFTYNRKIEYNKINFMLVDTIGFVSKLPHNLVNSFYNTLQEIKNADFIIHVVDTSSKYINQQINVVMTVLKQIGASNIPSIFLLNKWDMTISPYIDTPGYKSIKYSNKTKENIDLLLNTILEEISPSFIHARLLIPYSKGDLSNIIEEKCQIIARNYEETGTYFEAEIPKKIYPMFSLYDLDTMVS
jgi:GTP-binding protein HflX